MAPGSGNDGNKYEWQSWPSDSLEGMPPKHRQLVVGGLLRVMFLHSSWCRMAEANLGSRSWIPEARRRACCPLRRVTR